MCVWFAGHATAPGVLAERQRPRGKEGHREQLRQLLPAADSVLGALRHRGLLHHGEEPGGPGDLQPGGQGDR